MPSDQNPITGWHATDDETPVPVRSSATSAPVTAPAPVQGPAHDIAESDRGHVRIEAHMQERSSHSMTFSAVLGILIALGGVAMYLGIGNVSLRGDLTGGTTSVTISISDAGEFSPASVDVHPGDTVTIENRNIDPQVLKPKSGRELFPVQVVFDEPYTFTVAADAIGQYIYYSETLPADRTVTFNVTQASAASQSSAVSSSADSAPSDTISIPLPFGGGSIDLPADQFPSSSSSSVPVADVSTTHSGDTATIDLGGGASSASSVDLGGSGIPTNPYTVANAPVSIASSAASTALHSGAPLLANTIRQPKRNTETGPAGMMLLFIPALLGVMVLSRKLNVA